VAWRLTRKARLAVAWIARRRSCRLLARKLCAGLILLSFSSATLGLPLPAGSGKDLSEPFPCQNRPCGCRNAEECWKHCCCFSREEHLTWARTIGVEPPPFVDHSKDGGWHVARQRDLTGDESNEKCPRCRAKDAEDVSARSKQWCNAGTDQCKVTATATQAPFETRSGWMIGMTVLRCQGLATYWIALGAISIPPPLLVWTPRLQPIGKLSYSGECAITLQINPPDPPPRRI